MTDQTRNIEDLSDDEIMNLGPEGLASLTDGGKVEAQSDDGANSDAEAEAARNLAAEQEAQRQADEAAATAAAANAKQGDDDGKNDDKATQDAPAGSAETGKSVDDPAGADAAKAGKATTTADGQAKVADKTAEPAVVDYEAQVKAVLAPLKANGREIAIENIDEARKLMSMGAGFNKKMQALRPHLETVRMLDNAGINKEQLGFLIDLHKKDPAAINKLVSDSKIDPMDLSAEKAAGYKPGDHRPSETDVALDVVLTELEGSEGYARTLEEATKFDPTSREAIQKHPAVLKVINAHVENGIYDLVRGEMDRQRIYGGLTGLSDLEAYRQVGDAMHAAGKFAHLGTGQSSQGQQANPAPVVAAPDPKKAEDSKRNDAKRAVAPVKVAPSGKTKSDFNPLSMSDEEFAKLGGKF